MDYITSRLYAHVMLDNRIALAQRNLNLRHVLPLQSSPEVEVKRGFKTLSFNEKINIFQIEGLPEIMLVDLSYQWKQNSKFDYYKNQCN